MQVCTSLQTDNHASTPPLGFLQAGCPSCRPTNSVKALKDKAAAVLMVKGRIAAATYRTTLVHAGYSACFKMGQKMPPKIAPFPGRT